MRTTPILDPDTHDKVLRCLTKARWRGISVIDLLNREGLLWTPDREKQFKADTIRFILDEMESWSPAEFLRRRTRGVNSGTPADMYMCIREWLQEHLAYVQTS